MLDNFLRLSSLESERIILDRHCVLVAGQVHAINQISSIVHILVNVSLKLFIILLLLPPHSISLGKERFLIIDATELEGVRV